jgi:hypothetical protein
MAEASPTVVEQVTKAPMAFVDYLKKYWFMGPIIFVLVMFIGMALKPWFTGVVTSSGSSTKGDKLPAFVRSFLRISGFLVPVGFCLLASDFLYAAVAQQATCCAVQTSHGWLAQVYGFLGPQGTAAVAALLGVLGHGVVFGISHLSAPDTLDGVSMPGQGKILSYTPGGSQELSLYMQTSTKNKTAGGQPLIAVDSVVALDTTVEQVSTGTNPILSQDLARLLDYLQISSLFHGTILDKVTGLGPVLDLGISFVGQGFGRWGDAPSVTITVPGTGTNDVPLTKYFTFPWAQRTLSDPSASCPWLLTLDNMRFQIGVAASTALAAVSPGANTTGASAVRLATSYAISPHWRQNYIPYARLDQPASGADGLIFQNFGGTGPSSTKSFDMLLGLAWLSKNAGLPGNLTFDTLTNIIAPDFGLEDVKNIDALVLARRAAQSVGRIGDNDLATDGNYVQGTPNTGAALSKLLMLWLRQPSLDMNPSALPKFTAETKPKLRGEFSATRTGPDAMLSLSLRELSSPKMAQQVAMSGGQMPNQYRVAKHFKADKSQLTPVT